MAPPAVLAGPGAGPAHPQCCPHRSPHGPPTWWSRLQGCPITTDQAQRRLQTQHSRQVGAIWLQETSGQKNKSRGKLGSRQSRPCRARCGRGRTALGRHRVPTRGPRTQQHPGPGLAAAPAPLRPGPAPPELVKGGGASYTLTAAPHRLPAVWPPAIGDQDCVLRCRCRGGCRGGSRSQQDPGTAGEPSEGGGGTAVASALRCCTGGEQPEPGPRTWDRGTQPAPSGEAAAEAAGKYPTGKQRSCWNSSRKVFKTCSKLAGPWAQQQQLSEQHLFMKVPEDGSAPPPSALPMQTCHLTVPLPSNPAVQSVTV